MSAHVCIDFGDERYAIDVAHVREVIELGAIFPVPGTHPVLAGIGHLHGEILPVVCLQHLLGVPAGEPSRIVVAHDGDRCAGLAVDRVADLGDLPEARAPADPLTRGVVPHAGEKLVVLDIPAILEAVRRTVS